MFFEFHPTLFKEFHDALFGPYSDGFDPVNHVRYLALRRQYAIMSSDRVDRGGLHERRENSNSRANVLAILRSPRWNLARLVLEDVRVNVLDEGQFFSKIRSCTHPFRLISQLPPAGCQ